MTHALRAGLLSFSSIVALGASAGLAAAQTAATTDQAPALEEIVVTAQRRSEALQDVPVSVSALTTERLDQLQVTDLMSMVGKVPSLKLKIATAGPLSVNVGIRGAASSGSQVNIDAAVGVYVDGIYYARTVGANVAFVDMERVELLRGPQGTLFGRNTIGGALNIITAKPTDRFEGSVKVSYGNYNDFKVGAVLNVPIVADKLSARFVYDHQQHDGYIKAILPPLVGSDEFADQNQEYFRASFKAKPADNIDLGLTVDHLDVKQNSYGVVTTFFDTTAGNAATSISQPTTGLTPALRTRFFTALAAGPFAFNDWKTASEFNPRNTGRATNVALTGVVDLGFATFTSITGYRRINFNLPQDLDGTPVSIVELSEFSVRGDSFSQEFQLAGESFGGKLSWIGGLYYFREENDQIAAAYGAPPTANLTSAFDANGNFRPGSTNNPTGVFDAISESRSAYAQVTYSITPQVRLTAGARYVEDERSNTYFAASQDALTGAFLSCGALQTAGLSNIASGCRYRAPGVKFNYVPWTLGIDYRPNDDSLYYAKVSKGFRSGGLQACCGASLLAFTPFDPEKLVSYEVGAKLTLLENHLQVNGAVYHTKYDDIQQNVSIFNPATNGVLLLIRNTGKATINGGELEVTAQVGDLLLTGGLGVTDQEFTGGPYKGVIYPGNPKTTWSLSADYPITTGWGSVNFHADYEWQSTSWILTPVFTSVPPGSRFLDVFSKDQKDSLREHANGVLNGVVTFTIDRQDHPLIFQIWGRNLTNKFRGTAFSQATSAVNFFNVTRPEAPRTYGVSVQIKF